MEPDRWQKVRTILEEARERGVEGRQAYLSEACGGDGALRTEIEALLALESEVSHQGFLVPPAERLGADADGPGAGALQARLERLAEQRGGPARYIVEEEIGRGGAGVVLSVWDIDLRRSLAMKVLRAETGLGGSSPRSLARFVEEAQVTGQLEHPGVVPVHALGVDDEGRMYFTMRAVRGRTLGEVFTLAREEREGWSRVRAAGALLRVCETVAFAHARGVLHRDLKPANVMLGTFGEVYVMDWGLARVAGAAEMPEGEGVSSDRGEDGDTPESGLVTEHGAILGTPAYMAPEQAVGDGDAIDARADVYAVGSMLYELLAGAAPYARRGQRRSPVGILTALREGPPDALPPDAPPELAAVCERAMRRDPEERYAGMAAMADDLRAFLEGRVVRAYETGPLAELRKWVLRNKLTACLGSAAVAALLVGLGLVARTEARGREAVLRMSDVRRLADYRAQADELWPSRAETVPAMEGWLERARDLRARLPQHRDELAALEARRVAGEGGSSGFASFEDAWRYGVLTDLVLDLEAFADPERGAIADVERRAQVAARVVAETVDAYADEWAVARASIADPDECPLYGGLQISAQVGLIPLARAAHSGLWEFAVWGTGEVPEADADGRVEVDEGTAIVLILVPGGTVVMGAESEGDPAGGHLDPHALLLEQPAHPVELAPFFIAAYELTRGQWRRVAGHDPSWFQVMDWPPDDPRIGELPVENTTWFEAVAALRRVELVLPTEAQWEYTARGGTATPWWCGSEPESLMNLTNIADAVTASAYPQLAPHAEMLPGYVDGYGVVAPVHVFAPNPYGLFGTLGNVQEWCRDSGAGYQVSARVGDGFRGDPSAESRAMRGGSWNRNPLHARSAARANDDPANRIPYVGLRAARALED